MRDESECHEDRDPPGTMMPKAMVGHSRRLTPERRRELILLAANLAEQVEANTRYWERCLLKRLVLAILDD